MCVLHVLVCLIFLLAGTLDPVEIPTSAFFLLTDIGGLEIVAGCFVRELLAVPVTVFPLPTVAPRDTLGLETSDKKGTCVIHTFIHT